MATNNSNLDYAFHVTIEYMTFCLGDGMFLWPLKDDSSVNVSEITDIDHFDSNIYK